MHLGKGGAEGEYRLYIFPSYCLSGTNFTYKKMKGENMGGDAFGFLVKFCTDTRITALFLLLCLLVSLSFIIVRNSGLGRSAAQMACRRKEEKCRKGRPDGMNLSHAAL